MEYLPSPAERDWLLDCIADLIARRGAAPWVSAHVIEPTPSFLPDTWTPDARGIERVARRLLRYAELDSLEPVVVEARDGDAEYDGRACVLPGALPVRFGGLEGTRCVLAVDEDALDDTELVAAALAHAIAHAYRAHHGLAGDSARGGYRDAPLDPGAREDQIEERRVDVTAVYLGFGVLVANGAEQHKSSGEVRGTNASWRVEVRSIGALSPLAASFVLAAQVTCRRLEARADRQLAKHLAANQAAFFRASAKLLRADVERLATDLGVPSPAGWPAPPPLEELTRALACEPEPDPASSRTTATAKPNRGQPVFRVPRTRATRYAMLFGSAAAAFGGIFGRADPTAVLGSAALGTVLGAGFGHRRRRDECSDPDCESLLPSGRHTCPRCGGTIAGSIRRPEDRLAALEEIETRRRLPKKRPRADG